MTRSAKWIDFYHCRREINYVFLSVSDWVQLFFPEFFGFEWTSLFPDLLSSPLPACFHHVSPTPGGQGTAGWSLGALSLVFFNLPN